MLTSGSSGFTGRNVVRGAPSVQPTPTAAALPVPQRYVSLFRIDGVPILPPLMTSEKRRQMQKLKEKALKIESNFKERRRNRQQLQHGIGNSEDTPRSSHNCSGNDLFEGRNTRISSSRSSSSDGSMSQQSFEFDMQRLKREQELQESYLLLTDIMQRRNAEIGETSTDAVPSISTMVDDLSCPLVQSSESNLAERMQKLAKSETIIYDNRANTIIMPMTVSDYNREMQQQPELQQHADDATEQANLSQLITPKSIHLATKKIPSIYVDPPTPIIDGHSIGSSHNLYVDEVSSNESCNFPPACSITIRTSKPSTSSESSSRSEDQHSLRADMNPPQRSATSPQLKMQPEHVAVASSVDHIPHSSHSEYPLVRSNSYTLTCPSKALLEHIRKQKAANVLQRRTAFSASATRDTVESKAKRVQKVDLKQRSPQRRCGGTGGAGGSGHSQHRANTSSHSNCGISHSTGSVLLFKSKRSPYDTKSSSAKPKLGRPVNRKSPNNSSRGQATPKTQIAYNNNNNNSLTKPRVLAATHKNMNTAQPPVPPLPPQTQPKPMRPIKSEQLELVDSNESLLNQFEMQHHQKLLQLIAQQQEEQTRLQATFEAQQRELLAQLASEMSKMNLLPHSRSAGDIDSDTSLQPTSEWSGKESNTGSVISSSAHTSTSTAAAAAATAIGNTLMGVMESLDLSLLSTGSTATTASTLATPTAAATGTMFAATNNSSNNLRSTPRRRLFTLDHQPLELASMPSTPQRPKLPPPNRCNSSTSNHTHAQSSYREELEAAAATIINAHARGFLVRRLFQTEQIQRIVQTIRDTLIFVLNLHIETMQNDEEANTPANITLKARLLQQLSSATRTMHLVFFQTTVRERMDIIARDRKRIKTKLLAMNLKRSPRINSSS